MKSKIAGIGIAVAFATLLATGPSFGQFGGGSGSAPAAAPSGGSFGGGSGGAPQPSAAPRGGNRAAVGGGGGAFSGGGGSTRQAWGGHRGGHRGGYRGYGGYGAGVVIGAAPYWGSPYYAYDDDYYVEGPVGGRSVAYCMRRFRSYDPRSGTYLGNDGYRHACP